MEREKKAHTYTLSHIEQKSSLPFCRWLYTHFPYIEFSDVRSLYFILYTSVYHIYNNVCIHLGYMNMDIRKIGKYSLGSRFFPLKLGAFELCRDKTVFWWWCVKWLGTKRRTWPMTWCVRVSFYFSLLFLSLFIQFDDFSSIINNNYLLLFVDFRLDNCLKRKAKASNTTSYDFENVTNENESNTNTNITYSSNKTPNNNNNKMTRKTPQITIICRFGLKGDLAPANVSFRWVMRKADKS